MVRSFVDVVFTGWGGRQASRSVGKADRNGECQSGTRMVMRCDRVSSGGSPVAPVHRMGKVGRQRVGGLGEGEGSSLAAAAAQW